MIRFAFLPLLLALNFSMCKKQQAVTEKPQPAGTSGPATAAATAAPVVAAAPKVKKPVVDQTAQVIILCYHRLVDKIRYPGTEITPAAFEAQMKELKDKGITVIPMQDLLAWKRGEKNIPPRAAVITFDDGHRNFYTAAAPLLENHGMPALMFLISNRVIANASKSSTWHETDDQDYLSWNEVRELRTRGFEFGSHTCSHQRLPQISPQEVERELADSKSTIEQHTTAEGLSLAYPYGMATDEIAGRAAALGYWCAFTTDTGFNNKTTPLFKLHRTLIGDNDDIPAFAARVAGLTR